jgi:hypothetical protein
LLQAIIDTNLTAFRNPQVPVAGRLNNNVGGVAPLPTDREGANDEEDAGSDPTFFGADLGDDDALELTPLRSCTAGHYLDFADNPVSGVCLLCRPGTFSNQTGSSVLHSCPGNCSVGYTSKHGATTEEDCEPSYILLEGETCAGAEDTTADGFANRGYQYVTSREECETAAMNLRQRIGGTGSVTESKVTERCTDMDLLTGRVEEDTTAICNAFKHLQGGTCKGEAAFSKVEKTDNPISMDCSKTCSACGVDDGKFCTAGKAPSAAPVGVCVLETSSSTGVQRLSFYDACSAAYFDGDEYQAICKVLECSPLEQIQDEGATTPHANAASTVRSSSVCEPNASQYSAWCRAQEFKYYIYYILNVLVIVVVCGYFWKKSAPEEDQLLRPYDAPRLSKLRRSWKSWETTRGELQLATYTVFKATDVLSDWAFYLISIKTGAFAHRANQSCSTTTFCSLFLFGSDAEFNVEAYAWVTLAVTIVGTLLVGFDVQVLYTRHTYARELRAWKDACTNPPMSELATRMPEAKLKLKPVKPQRLWWVPAVVILCEDLPQLMLTAIYLSIVGFAECDSRDEVAVASLTLSCVGVAMNILLTFAPRLSPWLDGQFERVDVWYMTWKYGGAPYAVMFHHGQITEAEAEKRLEQATAQDQAKYLIWSDRDGATKLSCRYPANRHEDQRDATHVQMDHRRISKWDGQWHVNDKPLDTLDHGRLQLPDVVNILLKEISKRITMQLLPVRDTTLPDVAKKTGLCCGKEVKPPSRNASDGEKVEWARSIHHNVSEYEATGYIELSNGTGFGQYMGASPLSTHNLQVYLEICDRVGAYMEIDNTEEEYQYLQIHEANNVPEGSGGGGVLGPVGSTNEPAAYGTMQCATARDLRSAIGRVHQPNQQQRIETSTFSTPGESGPSSGQRDAYGSITAETSFPTTFASSQVAGNDPDPQYDSPQAVNTQTSFVKGKSSRRPAPNLLNSRKEMRQGPTETALDDFTRDHNTLGGGVPFTFVRANSIFRNDIQAKPQRQPSDGFVPEPLKPNDEVPPNYNTSEEGIDDGEWGATLDALHQMGTPTNDQAAASTPTHQATIDKTASAESAEVNLGLFADSSHGYCFPASRNGSYEEDPDGMDKKDVPQQYLDVAVTGTENENSGLTAFCTTRAARDPDAAPWGARGAEHAVVRQVSGEIGRNPSVESVHEFESEDIFSEWSDNAEATEVQGNSDDFNHIMNILHAAATHPGAQPEHTHGNRDAAPWGARGPAIAVVRQVSGEIGRNPSDESVNGFGSDVSSISSDDEEAVVAPPNNSIIRQTSDV